MTSYQRLQPPQCSTYSRLHLFNSNLKELQNEKPHQFNLAGSEVRVFHGFPLLSSL